MDYVSNTDYENSCQEEKNNQGQIETFDKEKKRSRDYFAYWRVSGEPYKLKLTTPKIADLERIYKCNLMSLMGDADRLPALTTMLQIVHAAMEPWSHGLKIKDVHELYDKYISEGGSMLQFYVDVFMKVYAVSGFFSAGMEEEITDTMQKMSESM
ncbi:MAG: DUF6096 family protein [Acetatifactor sp.]